MAAAEEFHAARVASSTPTSKRTPSTAESRPIAGTEDGDDEDDTRLDVAFIQGFASKIQLAPSDTLDDAECRRPKITIPKRGEKDFEPLEETLNLQEMMLQNSRQALFDALQGVRGMSTKSLSHGLITSASPYPTLVVARGHVLDTMGISVRDRGLHNGKGAARVQLLPEEAIYLTERGSLQLWNGTEPGNPQEEAAGVGKWCDEQFGIRGAVEMSVLEVYGAFMGRDGLTWQRYQAYAYLRRLGYTVQRVRQFIPLHFTVDQMEPSLIKHQNKSLLLLFGALASSIASAISSIVALAGQSLQTTVSVGLNVLSRKTWRSPSYTAAFASLRCNPAGQPNSGPSTAHSSQDESAISQLDDNPYLPFYHVWKPATLWSKNNWDKGSDEGLKRQRPEYYVAVVESRDTPFPTLQQLDEVFTTLPDEPAAPVARVGPQYHKPRVQTRAAPGQDSLGLLSTFNRLLESLGLRPEHPKRLPNALGFLRNGDRALVAAVNDCGNTGWIRFGRSSFEKIAMA